MSFGEARVEQLIHIYMQSVIQPIPQWEISLFINHQCKKKLFIKILFFQNSVWTLRYN